MDKFYLYRPGDWSRARRESAQLCVLQSYPPLFISTFSLLSLASSPPQATTTDRLLYSVHCVSARLTTYPAKKRTTISVDFGTVFLAKGPSPDLAIFSASVRVVPERD
ncbi:hypothetical protein BDW72DRAFT_179375 [Aspergillus terricola var. indicus]